MGKNGSRTPGWLFVLPWSPAESGGVNNVVKNLIRCFQSDGRLTAGLLITDASSPTKSPAKVEGVALNRLNLWSPVDHRHPTKALISFLCRFPGRCYSISRIVSQHNVAVINPHFPDLGCLTFSIMKMLRLSRVKIVLSFHRGDIRLALATKGLERMFWKALLCYADHIAVVSDDLRSDVLALAPSVAEKVKTVYNGVDLSVFALSGKHDKERSCAKGHHTIVSVGQFTSRKGHDILLKAFSIVLEQFPDVRLVLIGQDGPDLENTHRLIRSLALAGKVDVHVNVPHAEVCRFLSDSALYVSASRGEGFPLAVLEAAAAGLPVVCTRAPGLRELVSDGNTGRVVDVDDVDALAQAIVDSMSDMAEAERMAASMYKFIADNLSWEQTYNGYLSLVRG